MSDIVEKAISWAVSIANDDSHGYDQINRQGADYDCSSLIINAFEYAGLKVKEAGATYTGNMRNSFVKAGFSALPYERSNLLRGDVLLNDAHHTALFLGANKIVQASINEKGTTTGGKTGDQTGNEILVRDFYEYSKGWEFILRYQDGGDEMTLPTIKQGMSNLQAVGSAQAVLKARGYYNGNIDNDFGPKTLQAVKLFQSAKRILVDGIIGDKTWEYLISK